jgi:UDP-N-acetylmuramoyl-L-alanyl-D-glutamate--2,6-diaminopimelate ligase
MSIMNQIIYRLKRVVHFFKTGLFRGVPAVIRYQFPARKLKVIIITGTDGKTTSSNLVFHILNQAKQKTGLISTVSAKIGKKDIDTGLHTTAPEPGELHRLLKQMVDANCQYVVLEMTSHGAYQFRDWGIEPFIAGLTNISHEHLDYHLTYNNYVEAKCLLLKKAPTVVINQDDRSFYRVKQRLDLKEQDVINYSQEEELDKQISQAIKKRFSQGYNQMNARLAVKIAQKLGVIDKKIASAIGNFPEVPGRLQEVKAGQPFKVIVDFAHTPNALDEVLGYLKTQLKGSSKLIAVFGATGLRDRTKRPIMGQKAVEHADLVVLTAEDSRTEDTWSIIQQIKSGIEKDQQKIISIPNRYKAIEHALTKLAKKDDIVVLMGKGHEKSLAIDGQEIPWNDTVVATQIIKETR